jgi:hypothetical protein
MPVSSGSLCVISGGLPRQKHIVISVDLYKIGLIIATASPITHFAQTEIGVPVFGNDGIRISGNLFLISVLMCWKIAASASAGCVNVVLIIETNRIQGIVLAATQIGTPDQIFHIRTQGKHTAIQFSSKSAL